MAGGTWTVQNKVRPGVYVNFTSDPGTLGTLGERGIVTMGLSLGWGESHTLHEIHAGDPVRDLLGYDITAPELLPVKEALKRAGTLLLYRLNTGTAASAVHGDLTVTAKYGGTRGNDLSVVIRENVDDNSLFDVITMLDGEEVDLQTVADIDSLSSNTWVDFSGTGILTASAGVPLTGGADDPVTNQDHTDFLAAAELHEFNTIALLSDDNTLKSVYASFVRRLRDDEGKKVQAVLPQYPEADHEGVISAKNGVILSDGTVIGAEQATAWVAGATAGAEANESLTYQAYDDAVDVDTRYTHSQIADALTNGEFLFVPSNGRAVVEQDINSFTGFTPEKGKAFSKNRVIRVFDSMANDIKRTFESYYIGKVSNNDDGRSLFRSEIVGYLDTLQNIGAIRNVDAQNDVTVTEGQDADSVVVQVGMQPVDSVEKIYMKVRVN